jgi:HlyD family secretion protein
MGYQLEAHIWVAEQHNTLKLPATAVFRRDGSWAAFVLDEGKARLRPVQVGESNGEEIEIASGIEERERVVIHPSDQVSDGVRLVAD